MLNKIEGKSFSVSEIIETVIVSIIIFLIDKDFSYIAVPAIIAFSLIFKGNIYIGIATVLINLSMQMLQSGSYQEQIGAGVTLAAVSLFELGSRTFQQIQQEGQQKIREPKFVVNVVFAMIGISMMYSVVTYSCRDYSLDNFGMNLFGNLQQALGRPDSELDANVFRLGVCVSDYSLSPIDTFSGDIGINLESLNLIFSILARILITYTGFWASIFASLGQVSLSQFSFRRWIVHTITAFLGTLILGFVFTCCVSPISFALGDTQIIVVTIQALIYAISAALGANWGAKHTLSIRD